MKKITLFIFCIAVLIHIDSRIILNAKETVSGSSKIDAGLQCPFGWTYLHDGEIWIKTSTDLIKLTNTNKSASDLVLSPNSQFLAVSYSRDQHIFYDDDTDGGVEKFWSIDVIDLKTRNLITSFHNKYESYEICGWRDPSLIHARQNIQKDIAGTEIILSSNKMDISTVPASGSVIGNEKLNEQNDLVYHFGKGGEGGWNVLSIIKPQHGGTPNIRITHISGNTRNNEFECSKLRDHLSHDK